MANKLEAQLIIAGAVSNSMLQSVGNNRALIIRRQHAQKKYAKADKKSGCVKSTDR